MKASRFGLCHVLISIFSFGSFAGTFAADTNPPPHLTVELRDGSRIVGQAAESTFKFRSSLLGDLKLNVKDIRSVDCVKTNLAKLTTVNGDELSGWFGNPELRVVTGFGKVELAVNSIRRASVSAAGHLGGVRREGMVALWSGEGDGKDSIGTNDGTLVNVSFTDGKMGQAFHLNGSNAYVQIPDSADLKPTDITVEAWVKFDAQESPNANLPGQQMIVFKLNTRDAHRGNFTGYNLLKNVNQFSFVIGSADGLQVFANSTTAPQVGVWYHLAGTYDSSSGELKIYVNGVQEGSAYAGFPLDCGTRPVFIGTTGEWWDGRLEGTVDEVGIYNRALSASEIREDFEASNGN